MIAYSLSLVTVINLDCEQIDKENKALLEVKSKCVDEQLNLSKGRQPNVENESNVPFVVQEMQDEIKDAIAWRHQDDTSFTVDNHEQAIKVYNQNLALAKENGNLTEEGVAYYSLGIAYHKLGQLEKAIEYYRQLRAVCKKIEDRAAEMWACLQLARAYQHTGDLKKAIENYKVCLDICKDKEDTLGQRIACDNLGNAYYKLGEYKVALKYCQRSLAICKELGNRPEEERENGRLGLLYKMLNDFDKATAHFVFSMTISQEDGDLRGEGNAVLHLGDVCLKTGNFKQAKEYLVKYIQITNELKDEAGEERGWGNLGVVHVSMGNFSQAIKCLNRCLGFSQKVGDKPLESAMYGNLGNAFLGLGDFRESIEYFEKNLVTSKEIGDRAEEGVAYGNLGSGYSSLGNYKLAIQYHNQQLTVCKELGNLRGEGIAHTNLGIAYFNIGNFKQAIEFHQESLKIFQELKDKAGEGRAFGNLGNVYQCLSDFKRAAEYYNRSLVICKETGDRAHEGTMYGNLGCTFLSLGEHKEAIKYCKKHLTICKKVKDRAGEGRVYGNLSIVYRRLGKYKEAVDYHKQHLSIFKELGDKAEEGMAYRDLGHINQHLGDLEQAKEYYEKHLAISKEIGDRANEGDACLRLSYLLLSIGEEQQAMEFSKQHFIICKETGDICGEGSAYLCQAQCLYGLGFLSDAVVSYQSSVQKFNRVRSLLRSKDEWKISLRNECRIAYTALWNVLLELDRTDEALIAAEKGRAQALVDLLVSQYGFEVHQHDQVSQEETPGELLTCALSNTVFLAVCLNNVNVWLLQNGENVQFYVQNVESCFKLNPSEDLDSFIKKTYKEIGVRSSVKCEDRSLDALDNKDDLLTVQEPDFSPLSIGKNLRKMRVDGKTESRTPPSVQKNCLSALYDVIVAPVIQHLRGNELVIVPDGPLFLVPFAALQDAESRYLCESFRIRVIPSLTCSKMIIDAPPDHHCKSGALIVGDPWVQEVVDILGIPKLVQLPGARKEAEMIGEIVNSLPLTGSDATKEEVLKRLNSVALIHLAAHGRIKTGEIALAPNTSRKFQNPREEDFLLTMSDVLSVGLRARLVVLSCCHSGRGEIKDEGVFGIARAFLGAGARSVLVSLWALEDEATLEFMRIFYEHLVKGKKASEALNYATNYMRESQDFGKIRQWAPFVLIGDDVTLECLERK